MMHTLDAFAEACLHAPDIDEKLALTGQARALWERGLLAMAASPRIRPIGQVVFPARPVWLAARQMPKRKLAGAAGRQAFFHAIAHIEFVAVYLAWDIIYRFPCLPAPFYQDWLRIADEEARHFQMVRAHLRGLGMDYGDLPAHGGLWEHACATADDVLARLALVPRCLEARGLDVTPAMIGKFERMGDAAGAAVLARILADEIGHVERGSYWFNALCRQRGLSPLGHYQQVVGGYYQGGRPKGPFNHEARRRAGFSAAELEWLESGQPAAQAPTGLESS